MIISEMQRETALAGLAGGDPLEVLATIAALQLMPGNASSIARLEAAAGVAIGLAERTAPAAMTDERVLAWVNRPLFESDSPFNNTFTDEFLFHYGSFVVFPGLREDAFFVLRMLARGILHSPGPLSPGCFLSVQSLAAAALMTSDSVARKAHLGRGVEAAPRDSSYASVAGELGTLKQAVTFTADELTRWLRPLPIDVLAPLVQELPVIPDPSIPAWDPLYRPIVRRDDRFVLVAPHFLIPALVQAVLALSREGEDIEGVVTAFHESVFASTLLAATYMGWEKSDTQLPEQRDLAASESVFAIDRDKLAHLVVITDDLSSFDGEPDSVWDTSPTTASFEQHLRDVLDHLAALPEQPQSVLQLVVIQPLGRDSYFVLEDGSASAPRLLLTAAELETIPLLDGGETLLLWKYARSRGRFVARTHAIHASELDLFHVYREKDDSFYISDDALPERGEVAREGVRALREDVQGKRDLHGAPYINGRLVEVMSKDGTREIPIYFVMPPPPDGRGALLVEGYPLPVWVFAHAPIPAGGGQRYSQVIETIAYWIWRFTPSLAETCARLEERCHHLHLEVDLVEDGAWDQPAARGTEVAAPDDVIECVALSPCRLRIRLRAGFLRLVDSTDNSGERDLMERVVRGIAELELKGRGDGVPVLGDAAISAAIDQHAPLGQQKMMVPLDTSSDPTLDNRGVPGARLVQGDDEAQALDELGAHFAQELGMRVGDIPAADRTGVLNAAVAFHLQQLDGLVADLTPDGLLEWLVLSNEALTLRTNRLRVEIPTRQACFSDVADVRKQLADEIPKLATASLANRFLIEYIAAKPPTGAKPMSTALYDRLLAISAQVHTRGYLSDLIHFNLEDTTLSILPSGRLGVDRETAFMEGRDAYLEEFAHAEVARSVDHFPNLWESPDGRDQPDVAELDEALAAEVGLTLTQIRDFFGAMYSVSVARPDQVKCVGISTLVSELQADLAWPADQVQQAIDLFALRPRASFAPPGKPFEAADVYPWRFNRALSHVRRPFVVRPSTNGEEVVWGLRHTFVSQMNFGSLVIDGRWKGASSPEMRSLLGRIHDQQGSAFNDAVAQLFEEDPNLIVRQQVKKIGGLRIERANGETLGDIDVLVADPRTRVIQAVEVKSLAVARTPAELDNELQETFKAPEGHRPAAIQRHAERVEWLHDHTGELLLWLGIDSAPGAWTIRGQVVVDMELMSPYLVDLPFLVRSFRALRAELRRGLDPV